MKLAAVVITYYPDKSETLANCLRYIDYVDKLIIWENTPKEDRAASHICFPEAYKDKVIYMGEDRNCFIAYPLNQAVAWCKENGYTHILTMDQDSLFEVDSFCQYKLLAEKHDQYKIVAVNPNNTIHSESEFVEINYVITSGTIYSVDLFEITGGFREDFKIDAVDCEFSYRAAQYGFKTIVFPRILLHQKFGEQQKSIFGYYIDNYSAFRLYYIIRNHILMMQAIKIESSHRNQFFKVFVFYRIPKILLSEKQKFSKLKAMTYGLLDGLQKRTSIDRTF